MTTIRLAATADIDGLAALIAESCAHLGAARQDATIAEAAAALCDPQGRVGPFCLLALDQARPMGFAALSGLVPVADGRWGLFLQLLYVSPAGRGGGAARALMAALARFARDRGYARVDWNAMPGNAPATGLYASLGVPVFDRLYYRLDGALLEDAARLWPEPLR